MTKEEKADNYVSNHKDSEVRRMYGHHYRSYIAGYEEADQQNKALLKEVEELKEITEVCCKPAMEQLIVYEKEITNLKKEVEELKETLLQVSEYNTTLSGDERRAQREIINLKQQLEESKKENELLENLCAEALGEQNKEWRERFKSYLNTHASKYLKQIKD